MALVAFMRLTVGSVTNVVIAVNLDTVYCGLYAVTVRYYGLHVTNVVIVVCGHSVYCSFYETTVRTMRPLWL